MPKVAPSSAMASAPRVFRRNRIRSVVVSAIAPPGRADVIPRICLPNHPIGPFIARRFVARRRGEGGKGARERDRYRGTTPGVDRVARPPLPPRHRPPRPPHHPACRELLRVCPPAARPEKPP